MTATALRRSPPAAADYGSLARLSAKLIEIDPTSAAVVASLPVGGSPGALTAGSDGAVWVAVDAN